VSPDDLSPADRELAQLALLRIHLGRLSRAEWHRQYSRERYTHVKRIRPYVLKRDDRRSSEARSWWR
jgi:hypothetical protein